MRSTVARCALALTLAGCSLATGFDRYHPRDGAAGDARTDAGDGCGCGVGESCSQGQCMCGDGPRCAATEGCCDGVCTDLDSVRNCGECGRECEARDHSQVACAQRECAYTCQANFVDCDQDPADGCEASLLTREHCGHCDTECSDTELCAIQGGLATCVSECPVGQTACNGACANLDTSIEHCGSCGNACRQGNHVLSACIGRVCSVHCESGFGDCDNREDTGCETVLEPFYVDADGDLFGDPSSTPEYHCPGSAIPGRIPVTGDCDDGNAARNPQAPEWCDNVDQNCNEQIDENAMGVGQPCSCGPGAAAGAQICTPSGLGCAYPAEQCNGLDDDCDQVPDDGFDCVAGATEPCTVQVGTCTGLGTRACNGCRWGGCVPAEACDRQDNTCEGLTDEGIVVADVLERPVTSSALYRPRSDWAPGARQVGVVYGILPTGASTYEVWFARLGDDGKLVGSPVFIGADAYEWDVAFDGNHWMIAFTHRTPTFARQVSVGRVDATGGVQRNQTFLTGNAPGTLGPEAVRIDRLSGSSQMGLLWIERANGGAGRNVLRAVRITAPNDPAMAPQIAGGPTEIESSNGPRVFEFPAIVNTPGGATAAWSDFALDLSSANLSYLSMTSSGFGPITRAATDREWIESEIELAHEGRTDVLGALYVKRDGGNTQRRVILATLIGATLRETELSVASNGPLSLAAAAESNFGVLHPTTSGGSTFSRLRATDAALVSTHPIASPSFYAQGIPAGNGRYIVLGDRGSLTAAPVYCR